MTGKQADKQTDEHMFSVINLFYFVLQIYKEILLPYSDYKCIALSTVQYLIWIKSRITCKGAK